MSALERVVAHIGLIAGYITFFCTLVIVLFIGYLWLQVSLAH